MLKLTMAERFVFYCRTTSASTAPCTSRRMCCPTHCAIYCAPSQPLLRACSGRIRSPPPTLNDGAELSTFTELSTFGSITGIGDWRQRFLVLYPRSLVLFRVPPDPDAPEPSEAGPSGVNFGDDAQLLSPEARPSGSEAGPSGIAGGSGSAGGRARPGTAPGTRNSTPESRDTTHKTRIPNSE